jgi:hypothetical protein
VIPIGINLHHNGDASIKSKLSDLITGNRLMPTPTIEHQVEFIPGSCEK